MVQKFRKYFQGTPPIKKSGISIGGRFDGSQALKGVSTHCKYMLGVKIDCPML